MKLQDYKEQWERLSLKKTLTGIEALEAVKRNGYSLKYVKDQTEAICLEAVKEDGDFLQYVKEEFFAQKTEEIITEK